MFCVGLMDVRAKYHSVVSGDFVEADVSVSLPRNNIYRMKVSQKDFISFRKLQHRLSGGQVCTLSGASSTVNRGLRVWLVGPAGFVRS